MKKLMSTLLVSSFVLGFAAPTLLAEEITPEQDLANRTTYTKATAKFTEKDAGETNPPVIEPPFVVDPPIVTPEPPVTPTKGPLYVIPSHYFFGNLESASTEKTYDALVNKFLETDEEGNYIDADGNILEEADKDQARAIFLPPTVTVGDVRDDAGKWSLSVSATKFAAGGTDLKATHLIFSPQVFNNSNNAPDEAIKSGEGFTFGSGQVIGEDAKSIISSDGLGKKQTSYVHDPKYTEVMTNAEDPATAYSEGDRVSGAQLRVPSTDNPKKDAEYEATLTWVISADASVEG